MLKGENPAVMPVEQLGISELHINLKAAKAIGLRLPQSLLLQAHKAYE